MTVEDKPNTQSKPNAQSSDCNSDSPTSWWNYCKTFKQVCSAKLTLVDAAHGDAYERHRVGAARIQKFLADAVAQGTEFRTIGSTWSFSKVAAVPGIQLIDNDFSGELPLTNVGVHDPHLRLFRAGTTVNTINSILAADPKRKASLVVSGASDGQSIAGAISTGVHGAALHDGSMQDYVVGLHIATGSGKTRWLESEHRPVATDALLRELGGAERIKRADHFDAARVSLGSFGVILAVMIKVRDPYLLSVRRHPLPLDESMRQAMRAGEPSGLSHPNAGKTPYHFEVLINPYAPGADDQTLVTLMHEDTSGASPTCTTKDHITPLVQVSRTLARMLKSWGGDQGAEAAGCLQSLSTQAAMKKLENAGLLPDVPDANDLLVELTCRFDSLDRGWVKRKFWDAAIPELITRLLKERFPPNHTSIGTPACIFGPTDTKGKIASSAVAVAAKDSVAVLDLALRALTDERPIPGAMAMRFVKGGSAYAGCTRFPITCVFEVDGINCSRMQRFYDAWWDALHASDIDHAIHPGKMYAWNNERAKARLGLGHKQWLIARRQWLPSAEARWALANPFIRSMGLGD